MNARFLAGARRLCGLAVLLAVAPLPAVALDFTPVTLDNGLKLLIVHDKRPCARNESCGFTAGDANRLKDFLERDRYVQVLLNSNGGSSTEGQRVCAVLRARGAWVRVAKGHHCISACTAAFLGGVIREVDEGGEFHVHSSSSYLNGVSEEEWQRVSRDPDLELGNTLRATVADRVEWTLSRFAYVQRMIAGESPKGLLEGSNSECLSRAQDQLLQPGRLRQLAQRVRVEGRPALNEIEEATERRTTELCVGILTAQADRLGPRAPQVLRIMDIMTASRIGATINLSPQALREAGFVTQ